MVVVGPWLQDNKILHVPLADVRRSILYLFYDRPVGRRILRISRTLPAPSRADGSFRTRAQPMGSSRDK
jgi:hypothetical protein